MFVPRMWVYYGNGKKLKTPELYANVNVQTKAKIHGGVYNNNEVSGFRTFLRLDGDKILADLFNPEYEFTHYGIKIYGTQKLTHVEDQGFIPFNFNVAQEIDLIPSMEQWECFFGGKKTDLEYGLIPDLTMVKNPKKKKKKTS
jgi:hypothetical protein